MYVFKSHMVMSHSFVSDCIRNFAMECSFVPVVMQKRQQAANIACLKKINEHMKT